MKHTVWRIAVTVTAILAFTPMQDATSVTNSFVLPISVQEAEHAAALSYQCAERFTEAEVEVLGDADRDKLFPGAKTVRGFRISGKGYVGLIDDAWFFRSSPGTDLQPCNPTVLLDGIPSYRWELRRTSAKSATFRILTRRCGDQLFLSSRIRLSVSRASDRTSIGIALSDLPSGKKYPCVRRAIDVTVAFSGPTIQTFDETPAFPWK